VCANPRMAELLGYTEAELCRRTLSDLLIEPETAATLLAICGHHDDVAFRRFDGEPAYVTLTNAAVSYLGIGDLVAFVGHDTSAHFAIERAAEQRHARLARTHEELARLVAELSEAKLLLEVRSQEITALAGQLSRFGWRAAVGELIGGIAHHLNNPLGALSSMQRRLDAKLAEVAEPELRESVQQLSARCQALVRRLETNVHAVVQTHQLGHAEATALSLDLSQEIETALAMFNDRLAAITVVRDYGRCPQVTVPHDALHLVLSNLIDNSLRAMGARGVLTIAVRLLGEHVVVRVIDTGGGVPLSLRPRLFEPILSARPGGAGLGLSTAQRLARTWGGDVRYFPTDRGSRFEIRIPALDSLAAPQRQPEAAAPPWPRRQDAR
jgi:signal transduction histidine kinase